MASITTKRDWKKWYIRWGRYLTVLIVVGISGIRFLGVEIPQVIGVVVASIFCLSLIAWAIVKMLKERNG